MGYFQLINSVDLFVFYDDVTYIKGGWINRNYLKNNILFTVPIVNQSSFKYIKDTRIDWGSNRIKKFEKTLSQTYSKAKNKEKVLSLVDDILKEKPETISELAIESVIKICDYLKIRTKFKISSKESYPKTGDRMGDLVQICENEGARYYVNPIGGTSLYSKKDFKDRGLALNFINTSKSLSIIDSLMNDSSEKIKNDLNNFNLI
jgi:hypothetical protein